jgi:subtilisin-like proprotein convertase family protein
VEDLSDYYGHSAEGKWKLTVKDLKKGNTGKIKCFVISFYTGP